MQITKPTLLINKQIVTNNIVKMKAVAEKFNLVFRPHFKTHRSIEIAEIFKHLGISSITVSSVSMAEKFAQNNWKDITIAFPFNILETEKLKELQKISKINLVTENQQTLSFLSKNLEIKTEIFLKIDSGYNRTGINPDDTDEIKKLISICNKSEKLDFRGFIMHAGHTYKAKSREEILEIHSQSEKIAGRLKQNFPGCIVSTGDTPSCSIATTYNNIDEIRPGNFVYYDMMQYYLGSCSFKDIAAIVVCPVVAIHPKRNEIVIYGGGVHLSKEQLTMNNKPYFGAVCKLNSGQNSRVKIENAYVSALSQEHGVIKMPSEDLVKIKPGDLLGIVPVHICMVPLIDSMC
jgi:D-serine deaminase-like pyridoxal phosphate-dependent protein